MNITARSLLTTLVIVVALAGCGDQLPSTPSPTAGAVSQPPDTSAEPDASLEALVAESIAFRREFGLRSDEGWVRQVVADPSSLTNFHYPLTAAEEADMYARAASVEQLGPVLQEYGAQHPEEFGGLYIDQERGGILVVLFTGNLEEHGAAIARLVRPGARIELREVPQSEADLHALMERASDNAELRDLGVYVIQAGADEARGFVEIGVSTERADVQALFTARYGPAVLVTIMDPTGAFLKPRGTIVGRLVNAAGEGVPGAVGGTPLFGDIPMDSMGPPSTNPDGSFRLEDQLPGRWRLTGYADGYAETSVDVDVPPGGLVTVEIVLGTLGS